MTDYLTALRKHAEQVLRYKLPESALTSTPIEFIITTPAVWSDLAQAKTRSCAEKAGMGSGSALHIISEPEAAAMYALGKSLSFMGHFLVPFIPSSGKRRHRTSMVPLNLKATQAHEKLQAMSQELPSSLHIPCYPLHTR